jgi:nitroreductase
MKTIQFIPEIEKSEITISFSQQAIDKQLLLELLEAGTQAPSINNEQPWQAVVASKNDNENLYNDIFSCLNEENKVWAQNAPVLMVVAARKNFTKTGLPNAHAWHDCGMFLAYFSLQGLHHGIHSHPMSQFSAVRLQHKLDMPAYLEPVTVVALGYKDENFVIPEGMAGRVLASNLRKKSNEFVKFELN